MWSRCSQDQLLPLNPARHRGTVLEGRLHPEIVLDDTMERPVSNRKYPTEKARTAVPTGTTDRAITPALIQW